jgi:hypothetical protein
MAGARRRHFRHSRRKVKGGRAAASTGAVGTRPCTTTAGVPGRISSPEARPPPRFSNSALSHSLVRGELLDHPCTPVRIFSIGVVIGVADESGARLFDLARRRVGVEHRADDDCGLGRDARLACVRRPLGRPHAAATIGPPTPGPSTTRIRGWVSPRAGACRSPPARSHGPIPGQASPLSGLAKVSCW